MTVASVRQIHGRHVMFILAGFFGTMLTVNALFVYFAISTFNGIESDAYETGLHYNKRIDSGDRQAALGWSHSVLFGPDDAVLVTVKDRQGAAVPGLVLSGEIGRPAAERFTQILTFREKAAGTYIAPAASLQPGTWIVSLQAKTAASPLGETAYQIKERLWLKPKP